MNRPELTQLPDDVVAYIEYLEQQLLEADTPSASRSAAPPEPSEPLTTINLIGLSQQGMTKRTPRHFYGRQRRGGMGNFDLDTAEDDPPAHLVLADEADELYVLTSFARTFRLPVASLPATEPRAKGQDIHTLLEMHPKERLITVLAPNPAEYIVLLTAHGRLFARHRTYIRHGALLYDTSQNGSPTAACWANASQDVLIATQQGLASRFAAKQVPTNGNACSGIRLEGEDVAVAVTAVDETSGVFMLGADGKGTVRLMTGFRANKSPGAGGKVAFKTDKLVTAVAVQEGDDLLVISRLGKLIRFAAADVPAKEGVVQGVNCMSLRADECVAAAVAPPLA
jgi:DNA gyrase subunit A